MEAAQRFRVTPAMASQLRAARRLRDWTARELAERCIAAGARSLTRGTVAKIEAGARAYLTTEEVTVLERVLGPTWAEPLVISDGVTNSFGPTVYCSRTAVECINSANLGFELPLTTLSDDVHGAGIEPAMP